MFGLFKPTCPLNVYEKVWTEKWLAWLIEEFGAGLIRTFQISLNSDFMPSNDDASSDWLVSALVRICERMRVDPDAFVLTDETDDDEIEIPTQVESGQKTNIHLEYHHAEDHERAIAKIAHEVARYVLSTRRPEFLEDVDFELACELLVALTGLGMPAANSAVRQVSARDSVWEYWRTSRHEFLPARYYGYAFALIIWLRDGREPEWAGQLGADSREVLQAGLKFLRKTGDCLLDPDSIGRVAQSRPVSAWLDDLSAASESVRLVALEELEKLQDTTAATLECIVECLDDANEFIQYQAVATLAATESAAEPFVGQLIGRLQYGNRTLRAEIAHALRIIQPELHSNAYGEDSIYDALESLLEDEAREVAVLASVALADYGTAASNAASGIFRILEQSIIQCRYESADYLFDALTRIVPNIDELFDEQLARWDQEFRHQVLSAFAEFKRDRARADEQMPHPDEPD